MRSTPLPILYSPAKPLTTLLLPCRRSEYILVYVILVYIYIHISKREVPHVYLDKTRMPSYFLYRYNICRTIALFIVMQSDLEIPSSTRVVSVCVCVCVRSSLTPSQGPRVGSTKCTQPDGTASSLCAAFGKIERAITYKHIHRRTYDLIW